MSSVATFEKTYLVDLCERVLSNIDDERHAWYQQGLQDYQEALDNWNSSSAFIRTLFLDPPEHPGAVGLHEESYVLAKNVIEVCKHSKMVYLSIDDHAQLCSAAEIVTIERVE